MTTSSQFAAVTEKEIHVANLKVPARGHGASRGLVATTSDSNDLPLPATRPSSSSTMARSQTSATSITITKKRKSTGDIDEGRPKQAKQPRKTLDTFFAPQVPVSATPDEETGKIEHVSLNEEQIRVLKMVVDEEKNVFFTGSAGMSFTSEGSELGHPSPPTYEIRPWTY